MQKETRTNVMIMSVHITKFLQVSIQGARYDQINLLQIDHVNYGFTYKLTKYLVHMSMYFHLKMVIYLEYMNLLRMLN